MLSNEAHRDDSSPLLKIRLHRPSARTARNCFFHHSPQFSPSMKLAVRFLRSLPSRTLLRSPIAPWLSFMVSLRTRSFVPFKSHRAPGIYLSCIPLLGCSSRLWQRCPFLAPSGRSPLPSRTAPPSSGSTRTGSASTPGASASRQASRRGIFSHPRVIPSQTEPWQRDAA